MGLVLWLFWKFLANAAVSRVVVAQALRKRLVSFAPISRLIVRSCQTGRVVVGSSGSLLRSLRNEINGVAKEGGLERVCCRREYGTGSSDWDSKGLVQLYLLSNSDLMTSDDSSLALPPDAMSCISLSSAKAIFSAYCRML